MCLYYICAKAFQHSCIEMAMFLPPSPSTSAQNFLCRLPATGNCGRNSALLHLLLEHAKVKSWICPRSLLDESAFITLLTLISLAEMFLTITISTFMVWASNQDTTLSLESAALIEEKTIHCLENASSPMLQEDLQNFCLQKHDLWYQFMS